MVRLRLKPINPNLVGRAIRGSTSKTDALRRFRAKGGRISDASWYGRRDKYGREHSAVYDEAHLKGLDVPEWEGIPRESEIDEVKVQPYVRAKYEQVCEVIGEEREITQTKTGNRRQKSTGIMVTKRESLRIPYRDPKPPSKKLKSKRWVKNEILRKFQESEKRRISAGSAPMKVVAVRYVATYRYVKMARRRKLTD